MSAPAGRIVGSITEAELVDAQRRALRLIETLMCLAYRAEDLGRFKLGERIEDASDIAVKLSDDMDRLADYIRAIEGRL